MKKITNISAVLFSLLIIIALIAKRLGYISENTHDTISIILPLVFLILVVIEKVGKRES